MSIKRSAIETDQPVVCIEGDSAFGFSGMEVETICRYNLPICVVVFDSAKGIVSASLRGVDQDSTLKAA